MLHNHSFKIYTQRLIWWHHPKLTIWKDLHPKVELVMVEFHENPWLQKWLDRLEMNIFQIEEAKKAELNLDLIQKNTKLNSIVYNKRVLRNHFMKKWKNSIMISIFNQNWVNISHLFGFVTINWNEQKIRISDQAFNNK